MFSRVLAQMEGGDVFTLLAQMELPVLSCCLRGPVPNGLLTCSGPWAGATDWPMLY